MRKDFHRREPLPKHTHIQLAALDNAAHLRQHECLMLHLESTGMDAVRADVMYHQSCYRQSTDSSAPKKLEDTAEKKGNSYTCVCPGLQCIFSMIFWGGVISAHRQNILYMAMLCTCFMLCWLIWTSITRCIKQEVQTPSPETLECHCTENHWISSKYMMYLPCCMAHVKICLLHLFQFDSASFTHGLNIHVASSAWKQSWQIDW